jgi:hypothetical protein
MVVAAGERWRGQQSVPFHVLVILVEQVGGQVGELGLVYRAACLDRGSAGSQRGNGQVDQVGDDAPTDPRPTAKSNATTAP